MLFLLANYRGLVYHNCMKNKRRIGIIGGGASGLFSFFFLGMTNNTDTHITLIEKNEKLGKKLYITGKGRCNITNEASGNEFINNIVTNSKFMIGAEKMFSGRDTFELIEKLGVPLKTERGGRVFPVSDKSSDIIKAFTEFLKKRKDKCSIMLNETVLNIKKSDDIFHVKTNKSSYAFDKLIIATGGKSYSSTGSTGDGYDFAKQFGHTIIALRPALCPIILKDYHGECEGLSLKNVKIEAKKEQKLLFLSEIGEMLFTRNGISGPIVLTCSSYINKIDLKDTYINLDFKPALTKGVLDKRLVREFNENPNKNIAVVLNNLLPKRFVLYFLAKLAIDESTKTNQITKEQREIICNALKGFKLKINRLDDLEYAIITSGGVNVKEINPKTMESKIVNGLYFIGELLDVDGLTGGFNLQIAISTAYSASKAILKGE